MAHSCDFCHLPLTRSAPDDCVNPEHRSSEATLGLREAGCGCCVVVDRVALNLLRGHESARDANRHATEVRYQEHLELGPERCGCGVCRRSRGES